MSILQKVAQTVGENELLSAGEKVLVAFSGGPDSMALLRILHHFRRKWKLTLGAVYINHNIRPRAAAREAAFCRRVCEQLKITFHLVSENIPELAAKKRRTLEETARDFRYATFERLCREHGYAKVALGHHVDDRVETILFRVIRGTGPTGLKGMPVKRGKFVRPMFDLTKKEILDYLNRHQWKYCRDLSNDQSEFSRNFIRNELLPAIRSRLNPAVDRALLSLGEIAGEETDFLDNYALKFIKKAVRSSAGGKIELDLLKYNSYDKWLRAKTLRHCLAELSGRNQSPNRAVIDRLDKLAGAGGTAASLPDKLQAVRRDSRMIIYRRNRLSFKVVLSMGEWHRIDNLETDFRARHREVSSLRWTKERRAAKVFLDCGKILPPLTVRNIHPGDRFQPLGLKGTKTVSDYLTDRKIDKIYRDEIPVVCDREGIVWLTGFEISDRVKIDKTTEEVLEIEYRHRPQA